MLAIPKSVKLRMSDAMMGAAHEDHEDNDPRGCKEPGYQAASRPSPAACAARNAPHEPVEVTTTGA